jgi:hypothetical protein
MHYRGSILARENQAALGIAEGVQRVATLALDAS